MGKINLIYFCTELHRIKRRHSATETNIENLEQYCQCMIISAFFYYTITEFIMQASSWKPLLFARRPSGESWIYSIAKRTAITPPKVNRFGWILKHCEPSVGLVLADFGRDPRSSDR